jgi:hypothetical protein
VREALEATGSFLSEQGQIPHHFEQESPTYRAISGEVQPGPNIFWVLSCFHYAKMTQVGGSEAPMCNQIIVEGTSAPVRAVPI